MPGLAAATGLWLTDLRSVVPDDVAHGFRYPHDPDSSSFHIYAGLPSQGAHDCSDLRTRYRSHWRHVQFEFDLRELGVPVSLCVLHPDAQGTLISMHVDISYIYIYIYA